jgi:hypothetical protein
VFQWYGRFLDRKGNLEDDLQGRQYFWDKSAVKMTIMTWLTVKGDKQFVKLPKYVEFQRLHVRKKLSHDLNTCMSRVSALYVSRIPTNKNLAKRVQIVKTVDM